MNTRLLQLHSVVDLLLLFALSSIQTFLQSTLSASDSRCTPSPTLSSSSARTGKGGEREKERTIPKDSSADSRKPSNKNVSSSSDKSPEETSIEISGSSSG